jgi:gliding motility-associated-like protein
VQSKLPLVSLLIIVPVIVYAAVTTIISSGNWNDPANWNGGNIADNISEDLSMNNNVGTITILNGDSYTISDFDMQNGNILTIDPGGFLIIGEEFNQHNLTVGNVSTINVNGYLEIWGSINVGNSLELNVNGTAIIHGDVIIQNNAKIDIEGNITIDNDLIGGNNSDVKVDGLVNIKGNINMGPNSDLSGMGKVNVNGSCTAPPTFCASINFQPKITSVSTMLTYNEGDGQTALNANIALSDPNETAMENAMIIVSGNYQQGEDFLEFTNQLGISGSFSTLTGILSLIGTASVSNYQIALQSITYENTSEDPDISNRTVDFIINDGDLDSDPFQMQVLVTPINDKPTITGSTTDLNYSVSDLKLIIDNTIITDDVDDINLESALITILSGYIEGEDFLDFNDAFGITKAGFNTTTGELSLTGTASISDYQSALRTVTFQNTNSNPIASTRKVSFLVNDGELNSSAFERNINMQFENDPPVIATTAPTTATEDVLYTYTATVADPDDTNNGTDITWVLSNEPAGMVVSTTGVVTWTPLEGVTTSGTVTLTVEDGDEDLSVPDTEDFTIIVTPVNDPPTLTSTAPVTAQEDIEYTYTAGVDDPDDLNNGADITWTLTNEPPGMVVSPTGVVTWTPLEGVTTSGTVTLTVEDGDEDTSAPDTEDFTITVTVFNDPPVISGSSDDLIYTEGDGPVALDDQIIISDSDNTQIQSAEISLGATFIAGEDILAFTNQFGLTGTYDPISGDLVLTGVASIADYVTAITSITYQNTSFEPNTNSRAVSFVVNDGDLSSAIFTRNIQIIPINEAPVFVDGAGLPIDTIRFNIQEDVVSTLCVEVTDPESNSVQVESVSSTSTDGSFDVGALNDLCFTFTPAVDFNGIVYGSITICDDGIPVSCSSAIAEITITPVNDPPIARDDEYSVLEDEVIIGNVLDNDSDPDGDILSIDLTLVSSPLNGTITLDVDGSFTFTPEKDFAGEDMFVYRVCDNASPVECSEAEVSMIFEDVQDPVIAYQVLTPNDDAFNDAWVVDGIEQFPNNTVQIFDRWSSLVYQMQGYDNIERVWKGESNEGISTGKLPNGTYFYIINLGNGADAIDGFIELRNE